VPRRDTGATAVLTPMLRPAEGWLGPTRQDHPPHQRDAARPS